MSIKIKQLTKIYGNQKAVDNISFEVREGEIVGFLGPNGAGKSTTMKIATCYLPPTSGSVEVLNFDISRQSHRIKSVIGYLPEHNPLYHDMYVHEYLKFIGKLHGLSRNYLSIRIQEMIKVTGLESEQNKLIGTLSKGYRQRVGLAQSLIHDPRVLILDEPTSGLDPNQIIEIRKLITEISKEKTVLFSTHILQEVQALCDRVVIINHGKLVADDTMENLQRKGKNQHHIIIEFAATIDPHLLKEVDGVLSVESLGENSYLLKVRKESDIRPEITKFVLEKGMDLVGLRIKEDSIEDIFQELTKNKL